MIRDYLEIGAIVGTHGIHGELRVNPACDSPEFFAGFDVLYYDARGQRPVRVLSARPHKNVALLRLEGVDSAEAAQALGRRTLFFRRADARLEEGQFFIAELLGCEVFDAADPALRYGAISDVSQTGANDVWHIKTPAGKEILIPVIDDVVKAVDVANGRVEIVMLAGLMEM
ncbi:MAG: ribosome maturation factor RimM [Firmicutes bacterium]|nr:ribosome maturation factor RimM [Bacillota bacterium]